MLKVEIQRIGLQVEIAGARTSQTGMNEPFPAQPAVPLLIRLTSSALDSGIISPPILTRIPNLKNPRAVPTARPGPVPSTLQSSCHTSGRPDPESRLNRSACPEVPLSSRARTYVASDRGTPNTLTSVLPQLLKQPTEGHVSQQRDTFRCFFGVVFIVRRGAEAKKDEKRKRKENAIGTRSGLGKGRAGRRVRVSGLAGAVRAESWAV